MKEDETLDVMFVSVLFSCVALRSMRCVPCVACACDALRVVI